MYLVINKCITDLILQNLPRHELRNRSIPNIYFYIDLIQRKARFSELVESSWNTLYRQECYEGE
jgi:hypothetical protein